MATRAKRKQQGGSQDALAVWLDDPAFGSLSRIGTMSRAGIDSVRFSYESSWLKHPSCFKLDPTLSLTAGDFFPTGSNLGVFLDSCPDRWGRLLMKRRETVEAKNQGRRSCELHEWDFLLGVQDITRMGALRFSRLDDVEPSFLSNEALSAPPITQLRELQDVALQLSRKKLDDLTLLEQWLKVLVAPGSSLGGARPKANISGEDASLWIAKFPAADDDMDVGLCEKLAHDWARQCGIEVPESQVEKIGPGYHTFLVQRFDRVSGARKFFASAMTLLNKTEKSEASYIELAEFIATNGSPAHIEQDLRQLFRRVVFNVVIANRDDHLRNHGFFRTPEGWRLAPAYDMNPASPKDSHVLALNEDDPSPDLKNVIESAGYYRLQASDAYTIATTTINKLQHWKGDARNLGLSAEECVRLENTLTLKLP